MDSFGIQTFKDDGSVLWDSRTAIGGVIAEVLSYDPGVSGTNYYPAFAGRNVMIVVSNGVVKPGDIVSDVNLGYPRVVTQSTSYRKEFLVVVY